ncbi:hypothetical protein MXB_876 [Myxobolus squamalis]|nr:hypothetical protein MXB_876 [Myxobolus squamalis]
MTFKNKYLYSAILHENFVLFNYSWEQKLIVHERITVLKDTIDGLEKNFRAHIRIFMHLLPLLFMKNIISLR